MKKILVFIIYLLTTLIISQSCIDNKVKTKSLIEKYHGEKIKMPLDSITLLKNHKTKPIEKYNVNNNKIKLVTRINGNCHICIYELDQWKQELIKKFGDKNVQFIFYLYTDNYKDFRNNLYYKISGTYPLLIDTTNAFIRDNDLPQMDKRFHTFLLNKQNEVLLVGNPLFSPKIKNLYLKEINKRLKEQ